MAIFIDSGNINEIDTFHKMGILRGVTTNPTILLKDGFKGGMAEVKKRTIEIAKLIKPFPLSIEVTSNEKDEMVKQAQKFASWAENINVKITIHGPNGELDNIEVIHSGQFLDSAPIFASKPRLSQPCVSSTSTIHRPR